MVWLVDAPQCVARAGKSYGFYDAVTKRGLALPRGTGYTYQTEGCNDVKVACIVIYTMTVTTE